MDDARRLFSDEIRERLEAIIREVKSAAGAPPATRDREFVEAVPDRARSGIPRRRLPACIGSRAAVYQRCRRCEKIGIAKAVFDRLPEEALEVVTEAIYYPAILRAHAHSVGLRGSGMKNGTSREEKPFSSVAPISPSL
jgi:transposase